jgi:predicted RNA-binding protein with PIN domain
VPRAWIVDGMNVIGSRPTGWWRDRRGAMRALARRLDAFAASVGDDLEVVFDGTQFDIGRLDRARALFASRRGRDAADDEIVRMVAGAPDPGALRVVTSDAALADRVRAHGATVVTSGAFLRELDERAPE